MKRATMYLDEQQARLLRQVAAAEGRSGSDILRQALNDYLAQRQAAPSGRVAGPRRLIPEDEWRSRVTAALQRLHAGAPHDLPAAVIEAEITRARREVRHQRATRQRSVRA